MVRPQGREDLALLIVAAVNQFVDQYTDVSKEPFAGIRRCERLSLTSSIDCREQFALSLNQSNLFLMNFDVIVIRGHLM